MKVRWSIAKKIKKIIGDREREASESGHESHIVYMHENANLTNVLDDRVSNTHLKKPTHPCYDAFTNLKEFLASEAVDSMPSLPPSNSCTAFLHPESMMVERRPWILLLVSPPPNEAHRKAYGIGELPDRRHLSESNLCLPDIFS